MNEALLEIMSAKAEFKKRLKLYSIFQDLSQCSIKKGCLADLRRGLNSLNSHSVLLDKKPDLTLDHST